MTISTEPGTHTHTHRVRQAGRQAVGEYESGTLETPESTACQLAFSEMRIPFPSHHVFTHSHERPDGLQRECTSQASGVPPVHTPRGQNDNTICIH